MFPSTHTCWKWKGLSIFKGCWCFYGDEDDDNDDDDDDDDDDDIKQMMTVPISKEYTLEQVLRIIFVGRIKRYKVGWPIKKNHKKCFIAEGKENKFTVYYHDVSIWATYILERDVTQQLKK